MIANLLVTIWFPILSTGSRFGRMFFTAEAAENTEKTFLATDGNQMQTDKTRFNWPFHLYESAFHLTSASSLRA
jgi:hypothetical protein